MGEGRMWWRYSYEVLGGILIVVSSWATEQLSEKWKKRAWIIFLVAALLYSGLGICLDRQVVATETAYREEARKGQRDLQAAQKDNTDRLTRVLARLDEVLKKPDSTTEQKRAADALKKDIQGPRFLTDAQQQVLIETLRAAKGAIVRIITVGNTSEVQLFSDQIVRGFSVAGWNVQSLVAGTGVTTETSNAGTTVTSPINFSVYVPADRDHAVEIAEHAFKNANTAYSEIEGEPLYSGPASWTSSLPKPILYVVIGPKG